jgi:AAA family ATPase
VHPSSDLLCPVVGHVLTQRVVLRTGIPNADARRAILDVLLRRTPHALTADDLNGIAARTHGYVGADLAALVHTAGLEALRRILPSAVNQGDQQAEVTAIKAGAAVVANDVEVALRGTRPSAMREVFVETPHVRWTDVGGQEAVKSELRQSVEWPVRHPEAFARLGVRPPRGILLYGPPGCSKTLMARALASEAGLNFIAVKGAEVR